VSGGRREGLGWASGGRQVVVRWASGGRRVSVRWVSGGPRVARRSGNQSSQLTTVNDHYNIVTAPWSETVWPCAAETSVGTRPDGERAGHDNVPWCTSSHPPGEYLGVVSRRQSKKRGWQFLRFMTL